MVIPLHGQVSGLKHESARGTFSAGYVRACLQQAVDDGVKLVILDISSPGGLVVEMEAICETIIEYHDRLRIIAFPQEAYSAAAIIAMSCREIIVSPDSQFGAAVIIRTGGSDGPTAVDAKFASPHHAKQRQYMQASGQPYEVVAAMTMQDKELWWREGDGFTNDDPFEGVDRQRAILRDPEMKKWEHLDDEKTVLTVTAAEAIKWRLAVFQADGHRDLVSKLRRYEIEDVVDMALQLEKHNREVDRELGQAQRAFETYFDGLTGIIEGLNAYAGAHEGQDADTMRKARAYVNRHRRQALSAAQRILNADHELLALRYQMPDSIARRIEEDRTLLGSISRHLRGDSAAGFRKAAEQVNEVIARWRALLGYEEPGAEDGGGGGRGRGRG